VNAIAIEVRDILVIVVMLSEQQDHVLAVSRPPSRISERRVDVFQGLFSQRKESVGAPRFQRREEDES